MVKGHETQSIHEVYRLLTNYCIVFCLCVCVCFIGLFTEFIIFREAAMYSSRLVKISVILKVRYKYLNFFSKDES
jgi:hypothetical protein